MDNRENKRPQGLQSQGTQQFLRLYPQVPQQLLKAKKQENPHVSGRRK